MPLVAGVSLNNTNIGAAIVGSTRRYEKHDNSVCVRVCVCKCVCKCVFTLVQTSLTSHELISSFSMFSRFSRLRSLNLSNNHLSQFPLAICDIPTLTEVNLSCNYLVSVPFSVGAMTK